MAQVIKTKLPLLLAMALAGATLGSIALTTKLVAQPKQPINNTPRQTRIRFILPSRGAPPVTVGAATRGGCPNKDRPITALIPQKDNVGLTVSDRPTFWVYVPYSPTEIGSGEFSLQDEADNDVYRTSFSLPGAPGFVSVSLPTAKAALRTGEVYSWYFTVSCPSQEASDKPNTAYARGWVEKVSRPNLESQLKAAKTPLERGAIYAKEGIWYDGLTELAQARLTKKSQDTDAWADFLQSAGLENIGKYQIVGSIKTSSQP